MKKLYASVAMAVAVCASASAASYEKVGLSTLEGVMANDVTPVTAVTNNGPNRAPASALNAQKVQGLQAFSLRSGNDGGMKLASTQFKFDGDKAYFIGLPEWDAMVIECEFDAAKGLLRIPAQPTIYSGRESQESTESAPIYLEPVMLFWDEEGKFEHAEPRNYFELQYQPNGVENDKGEIFGEGGFFYTDSDMMLALSFEGKGATMSGFDWFRVPATMPVSNYAEAAPMFEYNPSEWYDCGLAEFSEQWFSLLFSKDGQPITYPVTCLKSYKKDNHFLLLNPYGKNTPFEEVNENTTENGFIYINAENPDCVLIRPNVYNGLECEYYIDVDWRYMWFSTNKEGALYYFDEYTFEDIIDEFDVFGDAISTMDIDTNNDSGFITLPNCRVQWPTDLFTPTQWLASDGTPLDMASTIKLPAGSVGVEGITADRTNVAPRYFNLQGVEVSAPQAGQVVIVKEGANVSKVIR